MNIPGASSQLVNFNKDPAAPKAAQERRNAITPNSTSAKNANNTASRIEASMKGAKNGPAPRK